MSKVRAFVLYVCSSLVLAASAEPATVTNTTCGLSIRNGASIMQTDPTSCKVNLGTPSGSAGTAISTTSAAVSAPAIGASTTSVVTHLNSQVAAMRGADLSVSTFGYATASDTVSFLFYTTGPVRERQILFDEEITLQGGTDPPDVNTASVQVGSLQASCRFAGNTAPACSGNLGPTNGFTQTRSQTFMLGQMFGFSEALNIQAFSENPSGNIETGGSSVIFNFSILDANGTSVPIFAAPEPNAGLLWLVGFGIIIALFGRKVIGNAHIYHFCLDNSKTQKVLRIGEANPGVKVF